jgi:hypothetical protein
MLSVYTVCHQKLCRSLLGAFLPLSELVCSAKPRTCDKPTSEVLRRHPTTFFPSKMPEIVRLCVNPVWSPVEFPGILHGQHCSRGISRGSRLLPMKSRVHGVLHGVDVPAREEPREVPRLLARFPCAETLVDAYSIIFCRRSNDSGVTLQ